MLFEKQIIDGYKNMIYTRCDDVETVFYFSPNDFDGLCCEKYSFKSSAGHNLQGYIYNYNSSIPNRLVVFDHGFGGGHRAYMKEIEMLCRNGYTVFSYDHTGCMESEGKSTNGMAQSLCDLNDAVNVIKLDNRFSGYDISVIGHSWGGFSTLNISALHPEISHIVVLSGFVSVEEIVNSFFSGVMKPYRKSIMKIEREANPRFVEYKAVDSLKNSNVKALLIYSDNDSLVKCNHYDVLKKELSHKENIKFILTSGKGHNPNYTEDAVKLLNEFSVARTELLKNKNTTKDEKKKFVASFDWNLMTVQDEGVWKAIFEHLDSK